MAVVATVRNDNWEQENLGYEEQILDKEMLQELQDAFCGADQVYAVCLGRDGNPVTDIYGGKEELAWLSEMLLEPAYYQEYFRRLFDEEDLENIIEQDTKIPYIKMCGMAIRLSDRTEAVWVMIGILREKLSEDAVLPDAVMTTTEDNYYRSMQLLDTLSRQYFTAKLGELLSMNGFKRSRESEKKMAAELKRSETMTAIVQMLESEETFEKIAGEILEDIMEYLKLSGAALIQKEEHHPEKIEIVSRTGEVFIPENVKDCPYFTGNPYIISSSTKRPAVFGRLFEQEAITAAVYLPVELNQKTAMYMIFIQKERQRNWTMEEVKFLNDVKRIVQSILSKRIAQNSLASSYASLEAVLENVGCGICVRDPESGRVLYLNQCYRDFLPTEENVKSLEKLLHGTSGYVEFSSVDQNRWFDVFSSKIKWVDGRSVMLYTIYEVTDKKLYQQKIERQANNDFLTGLYNRMRCEHDLEHYIRQTRAIGGQGALLYIDLDDFKHINDGLGHQYGDVLLQAISHSLQRIQGIESTCYRMGGDEFIIIITHSQYAMLKNILDDIRNIFTKPWFLKGGDYYCTMSMGVVQFPKDGETVEELIKKADIAMYEAKKTGKNRIEFYDSTVETGSIKRLDLEKKMRNATMDACREFVVHFQPIMGPDGACQGAEALVRWRADGMGLISPIEFIPLAEYLGLINPIGDFVLNEACRHLKYWNDMGHPNYQVNVNLSVVQLLQNDIVDKIRQVITREQIIPHNLVLEVTESLAVNDMPRMQKILAEIKQLGVRVAMDDFGTGYSSLNHIREMPFDIIKIDRCFVIDLGRDDFSDSFVKMVAELAATIGVIVCVEGVETKEQYEALTRMKIQQIQGFYYDRPMEAELFEEKYVDGMRQAESVG